MHPFRREFTVNYTCIESLESSLVNVRPQVASILDVLMVPKVAMHKLTFQSISDKFDRL